jgi:hypothetical protein
MIDYKQKHYRAQLRVALVAGHWSSPAPAKATNGLHLSWSELFRKAKKHLKGSRMYYTPFSLPSWGTKHADELGIASHTYNLSRLHYITKRGLEKNKEALKVSVPLG